MSSLILAPEPAWRETLASFFNRLAAMKGQTTRQLAFDMGSEIRRVLRHEKEAIEALAKWGHLSSAELAELLSWSVEHVSDVQSQLRGEIFSSRALNSPTIRGCPECLRGDLMAAHDDPAEVLVMRGEWQVNDLIVCVQHQRPLVHLWTENDRRKRFDFQSRLKEILPDLLEGKLDRPRQNVTDYDYWLRDRLDGCQDNTWLADRPLYAAVTLCRLIGAELAELAEPGEEIHVHQLGFEVVSRGEGAIRDALQRLVDLRINRSGEIRKTFGKIYDQFAYSESDDAALDTLRHLTRECILENWAIAPGTNVLGEVLRERRLHSVVSAGNEAGVDPKIIARVLTHIGILPDDDRRPDRLKLFDAESHRALLLELSQLVMFSDLRDTLKSTQQELKNLVNDGILSPRYPKTLLKACWHPADGEALLDELSKLAQPLLSDTEGWEPLQRAHSRKRIAVGELINAVRQGELTLGEQSGQSEFSRFCLRSAEVDNWSSKLNLMGKSVIGPLSAAEFAAKIGAHGGGVFSDFVEAGHTSATLSPHPVRKTQWRMTQEDMAAFHAAYTTIATLSAQTGLHRNTIRSRLKKAGVEAFEDKGAVYPGIYLLNQLVDLFPELTGADVETMVWP